MDDIYRIVGQLYINSIVEIEKMREAISLEQAVAKQAVAERDELLRMLTQTKTDPIDEEASGD